MKTSLLLLPSLAFSLLVSCEPNSSTVAQPSGGTTNSSAELERMQKDIGDLIESVDSIRKVVRSNQDQGEELSTQLRKIAQTLVALSERPEAQPAPQAPAGLVVGDRSLFHPNLLDEITQFEKQTGASRLQITLQTTDEGLSATLVGASRAGQVQKRFSKVNGQWVHQANDWRLDSGGGRTPSPDRRRATQRDSGGADGEIQQID